MQRQSFPNLCQYFRAETIGNLLEEQPECKGSSG